MTAEPAPCPHVPARPDVELTLCWMCGVEIIPDPDTRLWRPLTASEKLVKYETIRQCRDLFFAVPYGEYSKALWERLEIKGQPAFHLAENVFGRWVIVNGTHEDLAWSGSHWVPHRHGIPSGDAQICNFTTRQEALEYCQEHFEVVAKDSPGNPPPKA
jgi:hypothetical protein